MHESRLTPPNVRRYFIASVGFTEILVGYARIVFSLLDVQQACPVIFLLSEDRISEAELVSPCSEE